MRKGAGRRREIEDTDGEVYGEREEERVERQGEEREVGSVTEQDQCTTRTLRVPPPFAHPPSNSHPTTIPPSSPRSQPLHRRRDDDDDDESEEYETSLEDDGRGEGKTG